MNLTELVLFSFLNGGSSAAVVNATNFSLTGPLTGQVNVASTNFTVTPIGGTCAVQEVVTMDDGGVGGTFTPATLTFVAGSAAGQTFTYTPSTVGARTITATPVPALGTPPTALYTSTAVPVPPAPAPVIMPAGAGGGGGGPFYDPYRYRPLRSLRYWDDLQEDEELLLVYLMS